MSNEQVYIFNDLNIRRGDRDLVKMREFNLNKSGLTIITGPNGAGKSSLLMELAHRLSQSVDANAVSLMSALQHYEHTLPLTGQELIALYTSNHLSERFLKFRFLLKKNISHMSSGELQASLLIAHLLSSSTCLFMDEPFSHLSEEWTHFFGQELADCSKKKLVVVVSHHLHAQDTLLKTNYRHFHLDNQTLNEKPHANL